MVAWIEPLELETWLINVLAGSREIFMAVALFAILVMAGYFRMNGLTMGLMIFIFVLMFAGFLGNTFLIFVALIGGPLIGYGISKMIKD